MIEVLDHGFVRLVETMGSDRSIVQAARVSYGQGTKTPSSDASLIDYLIRNAHTSPLEMCEIKLHIKCPIFIARQWLRHRTASVNECSARYSVVPDEYYVPEIDRMQKQSQSNKQGSSDEIIESANSVQNDMSASNIVCHIAYKDYLDKGLSRELARTVLPVSAYTEFYWKNDLHNTLKFLQLRLDSHAQYEIRVYADAMMEIVKKWCPVATQSFQEHVLGAVKFSKTELTLLKQMIDGDNVDYNILSKSKQAEFRDKINRIQ